MNKIFIKIALFLLIPTFFSTVNTLSSQTVPEDFKHIGNITQGVYAPLRIAQDSKNNICVIDVSKNKILKFDEEGNILMEIEAENNPVSIAVNSKDELFVGHENGLIMKISENGEKSTFHKSAYPADMSVDNRDNLYIVDLVLRQVTVLNSLGTQIKIIGKNVFTMPVSIALDKKNNRILIGEHGGVGSGFTPVCKVWIYDYEGNYISSFGSYGAGDGQFYRIQGITVGKCGNIYVSEPYQSNISIFDNAGNFITKFGEYGTEILQLKTPTDIIFDNNQRIVIANLNKKSLEFFEIQDSLPTSYISNSDATICAGQTSTIKIAFTGTGPWEFTYTVNGANPVTLNSSDSVYSLNVGEAGLYEIVSLSDANFSGTCFSGCAIITVNETLPMAQFVDSEMTVCEGQTAELGISLQGDFPLSITYTVNGLNPKTITTDQNFYTLQTTTPGEYSIIESAGGACVAEQSGQIAVVNQNPAPISEFVSGNSKNNICPGDTLALGVKLTGTAPWQIIYTVDDKDSVTISDIFDSEFIIYASKAGTYEIKSVSDNICGQGFSFGYPEIIANESPKAVFQFQDSVFCSGQKVLIPVLFYGTPPYTFSYEVNNSISSTFYNVYTNPYYITADFNGEYHLSTITDLYCSNDNFSESFTINILPRSVALFDYIDNGAEVIFLNNSTNASNYFWEFGDGTSSLEVNPVHQYINSGVYDVILTASNSLCNDSTISRNIEIIRTNIENPSNITFKVYPNPAKGNLIFEFDEAVANDYTLEIYSVSGQIVLKKEYKKTVKNDIIDLNNLSDGVYLLKISSDNFNQTTKLFISK